MTTNIDPDPISVTITGTGADQSGSVSPDTENIPTGDGTDVTVTWNIGSDGWTFVTDGTALVITGTHMDIEFPNPYQLANNNTTLTILCRNNEPHEFTYTLKVQQGSGPPLLIDPSIDTDIRSPD